MPRTAGQLRGTHRILRVGLAILTCAWVVMWLSSYSFYTSLGLDMERVEGPVVRSTYLRMRWPGDGSFRMGGGANLRPLSDRPVEPLDLGGRFFKPPRRTVPRSLWNRLGFWWVDEPMAQDELLNTWVLWVGIPGWLPPVLTGAAAVALVRKREPA